jgi:hypothetical protein
MVAIFILMPEILMGSNHCKLQVQFEVYHYVNALLWQEVFRELLALTNDKKMDLNPLELNNICEDLWAMGDVLLTDECLYLLISQHTG